MLSNKDIKVYGSQKEKKPILPRLILITLFLLIFFAGSFIAGMIMGISETTAFYSPLIKAAYLCSADGGDLLIIMDAETNSMNITCLYGYNYDEG